MAESKGTEIASAYVALYTKMPGVKRDVERELGDAGDGGASVFGSRFKSGVGQVFTGAFLADMAAGVARMAGQAIGEGIRYAVDSVALASDLAETKTAIEALFGDASQGLIDDWSSTAAKSLGQTRQQALNAAKTFGVFGKAAGLSGSNLANFSTDLTGLATDLASFHNTSPEEAILAIGAALRGETEPIRQYGIMLDDASLKQKALELGIWDGVGSLSQQQKVLAVNSSLFQQAGVAVGDFSKTSDGLANQQRILQASLEDTQAKLGESLLPTMTTLAQFANDTLVPRLDSVISAVGPRLGEALESARPQIEKTLDELAPLVEQFVIWGGEEGIPSVLEGMTELMSSGAEFITFISGVNDAMTWLSDWMNWLSGGMFEGGGIFSDDFEFVPLHQFVDDADAAREGVTAFGSTVTEKMGSAKADVIEASDTLKESWGAALADAEAASAAADLTTEGQDFAQGFADGITSKAEAVAQAAEWLALAARDKVANTMQIKSPSRVMMGLGAYMSEGLALGISSNQGMVTSAIGDMLSLSAASMMPAAAADSRPLGSAGTQVIVNPSAGMSEETIGRIAAERIAWQERRAA